MINLQAKSLKFSNDEAIQQANWFPKALIDILSTFKNVRRLKLDHSQIARLQRDAGAFEIKFKQAIYKVAKETLAELKAATPKDTGKTRADWSLNILSQGDILIYEFDNSNKDLIEMLNYGTRAHVIKPNNAKRLHFKVGKDEVFATFVNHPGTVGLGFIEKAQQDMAIKIRQVSSTKV
jgi:hypothetical protein